MRVGEPFAAVSVFITVVRMKFCTYNLAVNAVRLGFLQKNFPALLF